MQNEICGFWRRIGAFIVDILILGGIGLLLGMFFSEQFVNLGGWGRAIGFGIAALYFGILNSNLATGQTIGKRLLNIQVVGKNGQLLDTAKSFTRYSILGIPYFLNGAPVAGNTLHPVFFYILSLLTIGFGFSIVYLFIFNRNTRQSLHDIIVGSYVIRLNSGTDVISRKIWPVHYGVCGVLLALSLFAPVIVNNLIKTEFFSELLETQNQIQSLSSVVRASVKDGKTAFKQVGGNSKVTTYIKSQVFLSKNETDDAAFAAKIANIILTTHKDAEQKNLIQIALTYGYDIGIASFWKSNQYGFTPEEWKEKIN